MALPKRRHSKARSAKRKQLAADRPAPNVVECEVPRAKAES